MVSSTSGKDISPRELFFTLCKRIEDGAYAPGAWLPSERALAAELGVDRSAIRTALSLLEDQSLIVRPRRGRPWVNGAPPTAYGQAEAPRIRHTADIMVAILPMHPIYPASQSVLHGINKSLREKRSACQLRVIDTYGGTSELVTQHEADALSELVKSNISGICLWHVGGEQTLPLLRQLQGQGKAVALVDRLPDGFYCDYVGSDNESGIDDAVDYLVGLGHRRIGFLTTNDRSSATKQRYHAFQEALQSRRLPSGPHQIFSTSEDDFSAVGPAYDQFASVPGQTPTAVVTMNDPLANYFIADLESRGVRVPEEMSVIGFDDLDRYAARPPVLTTMRQQFEKVGKKAADLLLHRTEQPGGQQAPFQQIFLSTPLIQRSTCAPASKG